MAEITDGTSTTILAVEADDEHAVVWTKPADLAVDLKEPLKGLVRPGQPGFLVLLADGSLRKLSATLDPKTLSALFTRAGGEVVALKPSEDLSGGSRDGLELLGLQGVEVLSQLGGMSVEEARRKVYRFLKHGLGNQVSLNVYDAPPLFDLDLPQFLGFLLGSFNGSARNARGLGTEELLIAFVVSSLNAPVYLALPLQDTKVVDEFLNALDPVLTALARHREDIGLDRFEQDFYKTKLGASGTMRAYAFRFGPVKWRFFWGRVGNGLSPARPSSSKTWPPPRPPA